MPSKTTVIAPPANLLKKFRAEVSKVVRRTAFKIEESAKVAAPVDLGFLRNSIYTATFSKSNYSENTAKARAKNPKGKLNDEERSPGDLTAIVAVAAEYGPCVEFGTRYQRAQPYFLPAIEQARRYFDDELEKLIK